MHCFTSAFNKKKDIKCVPTDHTKCRIYFISLQLFVKEMKLFQKKKKTKIGNSASNR